MRNDRPPGGRDPDQSNFGRTIARNVPLAQWHQAACYTNVMGSEQESLRHSTKRSQKGRASRAVSALSRDHVTLNGTVTTRCVDSMSKRGNFTVYGAGSLEPAAEAWPSITGDTRSIQPNKTKKKRRETRCVQRAQLQYHLRLGEKTQGKQVLSSWAPASVTTHPKDPQRRWLEKPELFAFVMSTGRAQAGHRGLGEPLGTLAEASAPGVWMVRLYLSSLTWQANRVVVLSGGKNEAQRTMCDCESTTALNLLGD